MGEAPFVRANVLGEEGAKGSSKRARSCHFGQHDEAVMFRTRFMVLRVICAR